MASTKRDYYEILEVEKTVTVEIIERSYKRLARQYHPDRNIGDPEAEAKFKEVNEAREILVDVEKRARYDRYGHAGLEADPGFAGFNARDAGDLLGNLFGGLFGGGQARRRGPQPGRDIQVVLDLTLAEAAAGVKKSVTFPRAEVCETCAGKGSTSGQRQKCSRCDGRGVEVVGRAGDFFTAQRTCSRCRGEGSTLTDPCPDCRGAGRVRAERAVEVSVPPGVDTGMRMELRNEGEAGDVGAPRGSLEVVFRVAEHPDFRRDGIHLICAVPLSFAQAALGAELEIPTLFGKSTLRVPTGTQTHTELRIKGEGVANVRTGRKGDLRCVVVVETPTKLGRRQEELLRELAGLDHATVAPPRKNFLDRVKGIFGPDDDAK